MQGIQGPYIFTYFCILPKFNQPLPKFDHFDFFSILKLDSV